VRPVWSRDGKELFYISPDDKLMSVMVRNGSLSTPSPLFDSGSAKTEGYDVAPDGRFLVVRTLDAHRQVPLNIIGNWRP
jgi:Tol biopolymer transport system component